MSDNETTSGGIGCISAVGIIFIILKILGVAPVASWSWLWVLAPFWIPASIGIIALIIFIIILKL